MKILVLSDIHANIDALNAVWSCERNSDMVVCAGDLTDYGFFPGEVIDWMRRHQALCVRGNHDDGVLFHRKTMKELPEEYTYSQMNSCRLTAEQATYLAELPEQLAFHADGVAYVLRHTYDGYRSPDTVQEFDRFWLQTAPSFPENGERRAILGHTHRCGIKTLDEHTLWMNPGSVSYVRPDEPFCGAQYILIEEGTVSLHCAPYSRERILRLVQESPLTAHEREISRSIFNI